MEDTSQATTSQAATIRDSILREAIAMMNPKLLPLGIALVLAILLAGEVQVIRAADSIHEIVVYSTLRPGNWDLYLFEKPGAAPRRLTTHPGLDYHPVFSPDGRWIVFTSERSGNPDLYLLDLHKTDAPRRLTNNDALEDAAAFSPDGRWLVFVSTRDGNADVFVMPFAPGRPEARAKAVNLSRNEAGDYNPAFSPDGKWITFSSSRDAPVTPYNTAVAPRNYDASEVYVMKSDGTAVRRLTRQDEWDGSPTWSPDGNAIFFYSQRDGQSRIYRTGIDGTDVRAVTAEGEAALSPTITHDGRLAFTLRRNGIWTIVSTTFGGSDLRLESDRQRSYWDPAFDSQSQRMVCHGPGAVDGGSGFGPGGGSFLIDNRQQVKLPDRLLTMHALRGSLPTLNPRTAEVATSEGFSRLVVSRLDGTNMRDVFRRARNRRYRGPNSPWAPSWSKDGRWLAFAVGRPFAPVGTDVDIWKFSRDGSETVNLTADSDANDAFPDFSPDSRRIVFRSGRDGNHEIYLMNADGTGLRRLTRHEATDTMPSFSSRGDRIAFTSQRDGDYEIYTLQLGEDGTPGQLRRITHSPGRDVHPKFSPDDKWLMFASQRGGLNDERPLLQTANPQPYGELYAKRLDDGTVIRLTHNKWEDGPGAWASLHVNVPLSTPQ